MCTLCRRVFKLFSGVSLGTISLNASAGALPPQIVASWTLQQTSGSVAVPTLGVYGAGALAVLVAVLMYRAISDNPRLMGALIVAGLSVGAVTGAIWVAPSIGDPEVITIPSGAECSDELRYYDTYIRSLKNNCAAPVTVTYEVLPNSQFCSAGDVAALTCVQLSPEIECVDDGGSVPVGETRELLGCHPPPS